MKLILDLTNEEVEKLEEQLMWCDEGPGDEGWDSDTLCRLSAKVDEAIERAKKPGNAL